MKRIGPLTGMLALGLAAHASPAFAHLSAEHHGSFLAGATHPLFGLDHILAMVAVGLWAAMLGGHAIWAFPLAFVSTMTVGFGLALMGLGLPMVEPVVLASVVVIGLAIAACVRLPAGIGAFLVGAFALFHGHAHGTELGGAGVAPYLTGFVVSTILLHMAGIVVGLGLGGDSGTHLARSHFLSRLLGGVTALAGIGLIAGVL